MHDSFVMLGSKKTKKILLASYSGAHKMRWPKSVSVPRQFFITEAHSDETLPESNT